MVKNKFMQQLTDDQIIQKRKAVCSQFKEARKDQKLTLKEAASGIGITHSMLSKHENGLTSIGIDILIKISHFYGVSIVI